jgi:hypothetical protein
LDALSPRSFGYGQWVDFVLFPPSLFITGGMVFVVVNRAKWNREFIAHFQTEPSRLRESHMVCMGRCAAADEAGLFGNEAEVLPRPNGFGSPIVRTLLSILAGRG